MNSGNMEAAAPEARSAYEAGARSSLPLTPPYMMASRMPYDHNAAERREEQERPAKRRRLTAEEEEQHSTRRVVAANPPGSIQAQAPVYPREQERMSERGQYTPRRRSSNERSINDTYNTTASTQPRPTHPPASDHDQYPPKDFDRRRSSNKTDFDDTYDPFRSDPASATRLMSAYFTSPICTANTIIPQDHLLRYAKTGDKVSTMERLFICTTLAIGSLFTSSAELRDLGTRIARWATTLERESCFTVANLSVILARLNLAVYYLSSDEVEIGRYYLAVALADIKRCNLNAEGGAETLTRSPQDTYSSLGLPVEERVEALRRAGWMGWCVEVSLRCLCVCMRV